jgi:PEP-CTERM motif
MFFVSRGWLTVCMFVFSIFIGIEQSAAAPVVWTGPTVTFSKLSGADPLLAANQDLVTDDVRLTRNGTQGLLNAAVECDASGCTFSDSSPAGTEWATQLQNPSATVAATNWAALNFVDWETAYGDQGALQSNILSFPAVVHLISDDIYLDLKFSQWGSHGSGGFSYQRSTPVPEPTTAALLLAGICTLCLRRRSTAT